MYIIIYKVLIEEKEQQNKLLLTVAWTKDGKHNKEQDRWDITRINYKYFSIFSQQANPDLKRFWQKQTQPCYAHGYDYIHSESYRDNISSRSGGYVYRWRKWVKSWLETFTLTLNADDAVCFLFYCALQIKGRDNDIYFVA